MTGSAPIARRALPTISLRARYRRCRTAAAVCTPAQLAQHDQNEWVTATRLALPGALTRGGAILYVDNAAPTPDRYEITVSWREAGADDDGSYRMVMEL